MAPIANVTAHARPVARRNGRAPHDFGGFTPIVKRVLAAKVRSGGASPRRTEEDAMEKVSSIPEYFQTLDKRFKADQAKGVKATFQFELSGEGGGTWHIVVDDGTLKLNEGPAASPTTTIKMDAPNYLKMINGDLSGTMAFMRGLLKVTGNVVLAQKMQTFLPPAK
jgi:putative sterol carrier protein